MGLNYLTWFGVKPLASIENLQQLHTSSMAICWNRDEKWKLLQDSNFLEDPIVTKVGCMTDLVIYFFCWMCCVFAMSLGIR